MTERLLTAADRHRELRERLANPDAVLSRPDLRLLGYQRRAVDAIFRACPVEAHTERKPLIRVGNFLAYRQARTFRDDQCVRPTAVS